MSSNETDKADTRASFIRQRRFLIGTSLAILGYEYLGLSIRQVNVLGNSAEVASPEHLAVVLIVVHAWAIYRYWTHFQELAPWRPFRDDRLARWRQLLTPSNFAKRQREGEEFTKFLAENAADIERLCEKERIASGARPRSAHLSQVSGSSASSMREEWNIPFYSDEVKSQVGYVTLCIPIGRWAAWSSSLQAWILVLVNRTFFSEYIVPIGLAGIAVVAYATNGFAALS
jgi:hypothetical protein